VSPNTFTDIARRCRVMRRALKYPQKADTI